MSRRRLVDHELYGLAALSFNYPQNWRVDGQVTWNLQHTALPCQLAAKVYGPMGEGWELLPTQSFFWNGDFSPKEGTYVRGQWCFRPRPLVEALHELVLPRFRHPCRIVSVVPEPGTPEARIRVEYADLEELFLAHMVVHETYGQINWGFENLYGFKARKGHLDALLPLFEEMRTSLRHNPTWRIEHDLCVRELNAQVKQFQRLLGDEMMAIIRAAEAQLEFIRGRAATAQRVYDDQWEADARVQRGRQDVLGGTVTYQDPYYGTSQHGYHTYIWSNGLGNYEYSDDPLYNPNTHLSGDWQLLQKSG